MAVRYLIALVGLLSVGPAAAESLSANAAWRFVAGKLFEFTCFDGSRGAGRILSDGSVVGTIQFQGSGTDHSEWLPAGTLRFEGGQICASINGIPFRPCFDVDQTGDRNFHGSVWGLSWAYCDFTQRSRTSRDGERQSSAPISLDPTQY